VIRTLQPRLTDATSGAHDAELLRAYIRLEVKLVDVAFFGVFITGLLLTQFFVGWSMWSIVKLSLYMVQFLATMLYIRQYIRPLAYPCSPLQYRKWYGVFVVAFIFFLLTLSWTYFGR
jgi:putative membrane protein